MSRIVARSHAYLPDWNAGSEITLHAFLRALAGRGHDVTVGLTWDHSNGRGTYMLDGVRVVPLRSGGDHPHLVADADVVITQDTAAATTSTLAQHARAPLVHLFHSFCDRIVRDLAIPSALRVFSSYSLKADLGDPSGIVVHPPVDADQYRTTPGEHVTLINLATEKGSSVFWTLASVMPEVTFLGVEGGYGVQTRHSYPNVTICAHTTNIRPVYSATKVLLMPSDRETWGRVAVEAMCSGIPVIATDDEWSRESIGDAGFLLPRTDIATWRDTIRSLLDDPAAYAEASKRARARADELDPAEDLARFCEAVEALA